MLLNGTELNTAFSRAIHKIGSHFRILPRDFAKLRNGRIAVEIEEVITSTNTMTFEDYGGQKAPSDGRCCLQWWRL